MSDQASVLRFITCGSVDDGKSTLIGHMLYQAGLVMEDQLAALKKNGAEADYSLLVDGLSAEQEQGITIDVAYRYFSTPKRKFIVADTPGHEQYIRNMATGASTADLAIVLVDARKGLLPQTLRHSYIVSLVGVRHIVLAINKMDAVDYSREVFENIKAEYMKAVRDLGFLSIETMALSALKGDNLTTISPNMPWHSQPLLDYLDHVQIEETGLASAPLRMPVQMVLRHNGMNRGYAGQAELGSAAVGDEIVILPSGLRSRIRKIITSSGAAGRMDLHQAALVELEDELDISRGDVLASAISPCPIADNFDVRLLWLSPSTLMPEQQYIYKSATFTALCRVTNPDSRIQPTDFSEVACTSLGLNDICRTSLSLNRRQPYEPYSMSKTMGSFILIDRLSNETAAMGIIERAHTDTRNIHLQTLTLGRKERAGIKLQTPRVIWLTGISGAGKSTIANHLENRLHQLGHHTALLDGDNLRLGLNRDLGFSREDRAENIRRIAETARLMLDAGLIVIVAVISPFAADRAMAREIIGTSDFMEVFVDTALEVAESRDRKGLYALAKSGKVGNFTAVTSPYEKPVNPEIVLDTSKEDPASSAQRIADFLFGRNS